MQHSRQPACCLVEQHSQQPAQSSITTTSRSAKNRLHEINAGGTKPGHNIWAATACWVWTPKRSFPLLDSVKPLARQSLLYSSICITLLLLAHTICNLPNAAYAQHVQLFTLPQRSICPHTRCGMCPALPGLIPMSSFTSHTTQLPACTLHFFAEQ